ncbi:MAG: hypothetical protein EXQ85_06120 [Alphaproteobacteria bacterium]|nr:hypothetical protein [Alphaproteobacteria bacterium]
MTDGNAGTENQCIGLAEAVGLPHMLKRLRPNRWWKWLPASTWTMTGAAALRLVPAKGSDQLVAPWPRLLIGGGKASVGPAIALRRRAAGKMFTVKIQDPRVDPQHFDLVVAPRHDHLIGPNVVSTLGALHRITPERLADAARRFAPLLSHLPRPLVAVLVGGSNVHYQMTAAHTRDLIHHLTRLSASTGAGLAVTASRRTGPENIALLEHGLTPLRAFLWDGTSDNPYYGMLALADAIVVTEDSVSMASEAASTGKPLYVVSLAGGSRKFREFHAALAAAGISRPFTGQLESWSYPPLAETAAVAKMVRHQLGLGQ